MNNMAYIAASAWHPVEADQMFQRIGDNWDKESWRKRETFDAYKKYASRTAGEFKKKFPMEQLIRTEVQTPEGLRYIEKINQDVQGRSKALFEGCKADAPMFEVYMVITEKGSVQKIAVFPETDGAQCVTAKLTAVAFGPPPTPGYVVKGYAVPPSNGVQQ
jgi:beta-glucosidase/6-phospho-beta-glucosidase/beta-galactosidase